MNSPRCSSTVSAIRLRMLNPMSTTSASKIKRTSEIRRSKSPTGAVEFCDMRTRCWLL